jgi:hypothetical protein
MVQLQPGCQSCNDLRLSCCASITNDESASKQQSRGIIFQEIIFSFSIFSHRENAFRLVRIGRQPTCKSAEAGGKTCAL